MATKDQMMAIFTETLDDYVHPQLQKYTNSPLQTEDKAPNSNVSFWISKQEQHTLFLGVIILKSLINGSGIINYIVLLLCNKKG